MLCALNLENNSRISSYDVSDDYIKSLTKKKLIVCPECYGSLCYKICENKISHFAHIKKCSYPYFEPETEKHKEGKIILANRLKELYPDSFVDIEHKIAGTEQISDVVLISKDGEKWAFEIQLKRIPRGEIMQRSNLYREAGVHDFWLLNYSFDNYFKDCEKNQFGEPESSLYKKIYNIMAENEIEIRFSNLFTTKLRNIVINKEDDIYRITGTNPPVIEEWK